MINIFYSKYFISTLVLKSTNDVVYNHYVKPSYVKCSVDEFMLSELNIGSHSFFIDGQNITPSSYSKGFFWGVLMLVLLSYANTNNIDAIDARMISTYKQARIKYPVLLRLIIKQMITSKRLSMVETIGCDVIETFHNILQDTPDFAIRNIKTMINNTPDHGIGLYYVWYLI